MAALGPFEARPELAVAVSGGGDSMALALLVRDWVAGRDGRAVALVVDHGLRPGSDAEARDVAGRLRGCGLEAQLLGWQGRKPTSGIQAAAREARLRLLAARCRELGVLHLLLAHQADDQAETVHMRAERGSGPEGLAGMAAVREIPGLRLLRPLLGVSRARLRATLVRAGLAWLEDPSNRDPRFHRARMRLEGWAPFPIGTTAYPGRVRADFDRTLAAFLARTVRLHPAGFADLDRAALLQATPELARAALARAITTVGGRPYRPGGAQLSRRLDALRAGCGSTATLGGCLVECAPGYVRLMRAPEETEPPLALSAGTEALWDGRFVLRHAGGRDVRVGALGARGWRALGPAARAAFGPLPHAVRLALPALWPAQGRVDAPLQVYHLLIDDAGRDLAPARVEVAWRPARAFCEAPFGANLVVSPAL
jgi:tRNA(Ile)-lysidine synthase